MDVCKYHTNANSIYRAATKLAIARAIPRHLLLLSMAEHFQSKEMGCDECRREGYLHPDDYR